MADETVTQQIVREAPEIEAFKLKLLEQAQALGYNQIPKVDSKGNIVRDAKGNIQYVAAPQTLAQKLPAYQVAGFTAPQQTAMQAAVKAGVGSFSPYMTAANQALGAAYDTTGEAADILRGADTRAQFKDAQAAMGQAGQAAARMTEGIGQIGLGQSALDTAGMRALQSDTTGQFGDARSLLGTGVGALGAAYGAAKKAGPSDFAQERALLGGAQTTADLASRQAAAAAAQPGFTQAQQAITQGLGALQGGVQAYSPTSAQAFMNPYQQQVIRETMKQIDRQGLLQGQQLAAQAVRAGAFGGEREGIQRAELGRNLMEQKANTIANLLAQGYSQAQANSMATFEQQQQRQLQSGQAAGALGSQLAGVASQAGGLGMQAAAQKFQEAGFDAQTAMQMAQLEQTQQQQQAQQSQLMSGIGSMYGQQAQNLGNMAGQESAINQNIANLLMQQAQARNQSAQTTAGLYGQQAQQMQNLGQGIGQLAGQQFAIGQQTASGLGALGGQLGQLGVQQGALGQTAQALQQGDINFLYNVGQAQQAFNQQALDAQRATEMQKIYAPYQQAAFVSDIYKGAPSSQMSTQAVSAPTASPFQQAVGIGLGATATAAAAKRAGLF